VKKRKKEKKIKPITLLPGGLEACYAARSPSWLGGPIGSIVDAAQLGVMAQLGPGSSSCAFFLSLESLTGGAPMSVVFKLS
jgi:hypothetical protein